MDTTTEQARPRSTTPAEAKTHPGAKGPKQPREIVKTWAFDSVGPRKYAVRIQKAANGNPLLLLVEGRKQEDGSYRRTSLFVWSEDFERMFAMLDDVRSYIKEQGIRTPTGHQVGRGDRGGSSGGGGRRLNGPARSARASA